MPSPVRSSRPRTRPRPLPPNDARAATPAASATPVAPATPVTPAMGSAGPTGAPAPPTASRGASSLCRLWWLALGNLAVAFVAVEIALDPRGGVGVLDALYGALVLSLIAVRYLDVSVLGGLTSDGEPATRTTWARYAAGVAVAGALLWGAAHAAARLLS